MVDFSKYQKTLVKSQKKDGLEEIELKKLHPPERVSKSPPTSPPTGDGDSEFFIDWDYLAHNSSFQRGFTEFIKHTFPQYRSINHRASKQVMNKQLGEKTNEITVALDIVKTIDSELLQEIRKNALFLKQQAKNN